MEDIITLPEYKIEITNKKLIECMHMISQHKHNKITKRELKDLIDIVMQEGASDIHFSVKSHPMIRVTGSLIPLIKKPILTDEDLSGFIKILMNEVQYENFKEEYEMDFSYQHADGMRFRGNAFFQKGSMSLEAVREKVDEAFAS